MVRVGLVSVSYRGLSPRAVVDRTVAAGIEGIEWNGNVHVPHGDLGRAVEVGRLTRAAGLSVAAYGSYYRAGWSDSQNPSPESVVATALELGAPLIRIWAGRKASSVCSEDDRCRTGDAIASFCALASRGNIEVALEYHPNTLADTSESTIQLLDSVAAPNLKTLWQPAVDLSAAENLAQLRRLGSRVANLHAYAIEQQHGESMQLPLADHRQRWKDYLGALPNDSRSRWVLLEIGGYEDYTMQQLTEDAEILRDALRGFLQPRNR